MHGDACLINPFSYRVYRMSAFDRLGACPNEKGAPVSRSAPFFKPVPQDQAE